MILEMKSIVRLLLVGFVFQLLTANEANAQTYQLHIDSLVGIPQTVVDGDSISFYMIVSMNTPLFYQGDLFVEFEYGGNFYRADSTIWQNTFLGPNSPNTVQVHHRISTENDLSIGDNVVVVWPRIGDGVNPPQEVDNPETVTIHIVEPNSVEENSSRRIQRSFISPNPAISSINFSLDADIKVQRSILYDLTGKILSEVRGEKQLDVSRLPAGIYFVDVLTEKGYVYSDKLLITR